MRGILVNKMLNKSDIVRALTLSDLSVWSGSALITIIAPLFVLSQIKGATLTDYGVSAMIYTAIGALVTVPIGRFMDAKKGYIDELLILAASNFIRGAALIYLAFSHEIWQLYMVQIITGMAKSMNLNSWRVLFSKSLNPDHAGVQWGVYDSITSIGLGVAAFLGGLIGDKVGLQWVVLIGGIMSVIATIFPLLAYKSVKLIK
jgi:predicted MFS family arabinose efflux permease